MRAYLRDASGEIVRIDVSGKNKLRTLLKKGYKRLTPTERLEYIKKQKKEAIKRIKDANLLDVFFSSPKKSRNDGYGTTKGLLKRECEKHGVYLNKFYNGQKVGLVYNYPYALENMECEHKVLFTMFESTKMPSDWGKYLKMADEVIVPSKFCQRVLKSQFDVDSTVINLGYDSEKFYLLPRPWPQKEKFTFLHYDAFKWRKGWDLVLNAFDEEFGDDEPVELILKTTKTDSTPPLGEYKNVKKICESMSREDMKDLMQKSDCFVFPSRGEGFGLTPLEAMATGMPSIFSNAHGLSEYHDWDLNPNLEITPIKARYDNNRFEGMDLGLMYQTTLRSLRGAMRDMFNISNDWEAWKKYGYESSKYAGKWTIQKTGEELAKFLQNSYKKAGEDRKNKIVFLTEDTQHVTGGRYYSWWLATALKACGFDVEIYTNRMPVFINEFKEYPQPTVYITENISQVDVKARCYYGSPVIGNLRACQLSEKYGVKAYCEIFDPFPMMAKYKGQHKYSDWDNLISMMKKDGVDIISLCKETNKWIYPWLCKRKNQVHTVYPCINSRERDKSKVDKKENWAVFVSRLDFHKNLDHVLEAVKETDLELHIITSIDGINFEEMVKEYGMQDRVKIHWFATDEEKFEIIKKSKVMINGATFEGFGIWLAEALACGVPCVCYDYPTFREIAGENNELVLYSDWNNPEDLKEQFKFAVDLANSKYEKPNWKPTKRFDFEAMTDKFKEIMFREPKIGVITICLNEENYIYSSITSLLNHPHIAKIAVVEGLVEQNEHTPNKNYLSVDNTKNEVLRAIEKDENGKIIYDRYGYASNKSELRNKALELVGKDMDYILIVDGDEVWKHEDLDKLVDFIKKNPETGTIWFNFFHFWKKPDLIATGGQWNAKLFRFFKYEDKTLHWEKHECPVVDKNSISICDKLPEKELSDVNVYHYGYMKPNERVQEKLKYYAKRDTNLEVKDTYSNWKKGEETQPTHQGGQAEQFKGEHPKEIRQLFNKKNES